MRAIRDSAGTCWTVQVVSHGRTSGYLNHKVHRPVVQFTPGGPGKVRLYAALPSDVDSVDGLDDNRLMELLQRARAH